MNTPSMGKSATIGAVLLGGSRFISVGMSIISTIVVARILTPMDYGIIAMVAPAMGLAYLFQDLGLGQAAIQSPKLTDRQSNSLFWLNLTFSSVVTILLVAAAPFAAWFYGSKEAGYITAASAANVLVSGAAIQPTALLTRQLRFKALSAIDIASASAGLISTIVTALILRSYWALWIGSFVAVLANLLLVMLSNSWRPSYPSMQGAGDMMRFGANMTGFNLFNFFSRNADNILIGRVWGATQLGLYDRSYRLMTFPLQNINAPVSRVMLPILSRLHDQPDRYRRAFLSAFQAVILATVPGIAIACATSDRLVEFLLGERWAVAAPIFFWLSIAGFLQPIGNALGLLFMSSGRSRAMFHWGIVSAIVLVAAFCIGVSGGAVGVAKAYAISTVVVTPLLFAWATHDNHVTAGDLYRVCLPYAISSAAAFGLVDMLKSSMSTTPLIVCGLAASYTFALASTLATAPGRALFTSVLSAFRRAT